MSGPVEPKDVACTDEPLAGIEVRQGREAFERPREPDGSKFRMTAGHGIAHAELGALGPLRGAQLWIAQPEQTRHGESAFEHHTELPRVELDNAEATVLVGATSPARTDTPLIGADVRRAGTTDIPADDTFEYAVVPLDGTVKVGDDLVDHGWLALIPSGATTMPISASSDGVRCMVLGGEPLGEPITMWWNFVGRDRDEITPAWRAWQDHDDDRFGVVPSQLERIDAPVPPWRRR